MLLTLLLFGRTLLFTPSDFAAAAAVDNDAFDTGLELYQAYNFDAALAQFDAAVARDPHCDLCVWGGAVAKISLRATFGENFSSASALQQVSAAHRRASAAGHGLAAALLDAVYEYLSAAGPSSAALEVYVQKLRRVAEDYPRQPDVAFELANALLAQVSFGCHCPGGRLADDAQVFTVLARGMLAAPHHPGLHHLMVHAAERTEHPERGLPSAHLLPQLRPELGHMVHMPAHIFLRLGQHAQAEQANHAAIAVDDAYLRSVSDAGWYYDGMVLHNHYFLWFNLLMQRDLEGAAGEAQTLVRMIRSQTRRLRTLEQLLASAPALTAIRRGEAPQVDADAGPYVQALAQLGQGLVAVRAGRLGAAHDHKDALLRLQDALEALGLGAVGAVAQNLLSAEICAAADNWLVADLWYQSAIAQEDALPYMEPWLWQLPVREFYAAALLQQGEAQRAITLCDEELRLHPNNPYAQDVRMRAAPKT